MDEGPKAHALHDAADRNSPAFLHAAIEAVHAALPDSQVVVMPGQQHTAMNTAPELFTREILQFLTEAEQIARL